MIGDSMPVALAAEWQADAWDQNAALVATSHIGAKIVNVSLRWLLDVLDLPEDAGGAFVTGATMANFTAFAAARHALLLRQGWDMEVR